MAKSPAESTAAKTSKSSKSKSAKPPTDKQKSETSDKADLRSDTSERSSEQFTYKYPRPAVTADVVLFTVAGDLSSLRLEVLLIQRDREPYLGAWALPGGFVQVDEDLSAAAFRELQEETGVQEVVLEQVGAVGTPGRDPRGHTVTVVYVGLTRGGGHHLRAGGDAAGVRWFSVEDGALPELAFDHQELLYRALEHLRRRIREVPLCFNLLPEIFSMSELQTLVQVILGRPVDRRNFRRKILQLRFVTPLPGVRRQRASRGHRPAQLFRFVPEAFSEYQARQKALPF